MNNNAVARLNAVLASIKEQAVLSQQELQKAIDKVADQISTKFKCTPQKKAKARGPSSLEQHFSVIGPKSDQDVGKMLVRKGFEESEKGLYEKQIGEFRCEITVFPETQKGKFGYRLEVFVCDDTVD